MEQSAKLWPWKKKKEEQEEEKGEVLMASLTL